MTLVEYYALYYVQTALSAVIFVACFYKFQARSKTIRLIGLLFFASFLASGIGLKFYPNETGSVYDLVSILILTLIFNHVTSGKFNKLFFTFTAIYLIFGISNLIFLQKSGIASYTKLFSSLLIIFYAIIYFYRLMVELPTVHLQRLPMFWFNSGFLLYYAGNVFVFAFMSYLVEVLKDDLILYGGFHNMLWIITEGLVIVGVMFDLKQTRSSDYQRQPKLQ